jgi:hypothetical protein
LSKGSDAEREYDPMGWVMTGPSSTLYPSIGTSASAVARDRHATPTSTNRTLLRQKTRVDDIQTQTGDDLYPHAAIAGLLLVGDHRPADHEGPPSSEVKDMTWLRFHRVRTGSFREAARPAHEGINPFTKEKQLFAGKPESKTVKASPVKAVKDAVG